ncbi:MAG: hypothetical protein NC924_09705 [Candidatus Omnitrophica bacterium]|nr:hypothetical protein [Candidatus Omnitrophota bacterium]
MSENNLFIQRRIQVQRDSEQGCVHFIGTLYIAYYFYVNGELYVSKYALCLNFTKSIAEVEQKINK